MNIFVKPPKIFSLDFAGRYGRLNFINAFMIFTIAVGILFSIFFFFAAAIGGNAPIIIAIVIGIPFLIMELRISVLRLHDLNLSAFLILLFLVPVANIVLHLLLLALPGTPGDNRFGPRSEQGSYLGLVTLIILSFVSSFLMFAMVV